MEGNRNRLRFAFFRILTILAFAIIAFRLWDLQIVSSEDYRDSANRNRFRLASVDAPRGIIYDRSGRILVRNVPSFAVNIVPAGLPEDAEARETVLARVGDLLDIPVSPVIVTTGTVSADIKSGKVTRIEEILTERTISPYAPVRIASNVDRQAAFIIEEEHLELPGVLVEVEPLRCYAEGPLAAHLLGYVGRISREALQDYTEQGYEPDDLVGMTGIELTQEDVLRGVKGQKHIEVDAFEREVAVIASKPPLQGHNVVLTIDTELQQVVEDALRKGMREADSAVGVAVVMDPRTGEVLAMVSLPSYDNNLFSGGISYEAYDVLSSDKRRPLVNHAISGQYPPGSTYKIVTAAAALEEQVIDLSTRFTCEGRLWLPNKHYPDDPEKAQEFFCWYEPGHGPLNVVGALLQSCDIFFYQVAGGYGDFQGLGVERLAAYAAMFGFGEPSGIELSGEAAGLLPSDRWKRQNYGENWFTGDTYNAAIGQGFVLATPLQVLNATNAIANGGTLYHPQLVYQITDAEGNVIQPFEAKPIGELEVEERHLETVREGMRRAVTQGTAWLIRLPGLAVAGKTGTAEYPAIDEEGNLILDEEGNLPTHAWFTAYAPYEDPEIALVVFLEGGGEGSQVAVPVAAEIMHHYFDLPEPTPVPTKEVGLAIRPTRM
jgi:penicillin-binding protein 2